MTKLTFDKFNLSKSMQQAIADMGFEEASLIQSETIPLILEGKDVIGNAQTGTGKTAAFAIPTIENLDPTMREIQAIVLCPTRELVIQVTEEFRKLMKYKERMSVVAIYGGQEIDRQFRSLKNNPQVIIGTPGRMMDHLNRGTINLKSIKFVILDEADEMLDMGFREDIEIILKDTPADRQTVMFSATLPDAIVRLMKHYQKSPVKVDVTRHSTNAPKIEQVYFEVREKGKPEALARLLDLHGIKLALVFCNTKVGVDELVENLKTRGYFAEALHGDLSQRQRDKVMSGFRGGSVEILVATDVAGRGIDVNDIEAVFNYDLPQDDEDYIHRIGRTGRAGKSGIAFSFVSGKQIYNLKSIEKANNIRITRRQLPSVDDLDETRVKNIGIKIKEAVEKGHLNKYINLVEELMGDDFTSLDVAAALLKMTIDTKNDGFDSSIVLDDDYSKLRDFKRSKPDFKKKREYSAPKRFDTPKFSRFGKKRSDSRERSR